jgi:hypothetical protein
MTRLIISILAFVFISSTSFAACYTPAQYRAEQALRFHTNLMVIGLYCKRVMNQDTYATYQTFTSRNQNVIRNEENQMISYFKQVKSPSAERALHSWRTDIANKTSLQASKSIVTFCRQYAGNYNTAKTMIPADFQRWINQINTQQRVQSSQPLCAAAQNSK